MKLGPYALNDIYTGECAEMMSHLPDDCIDLTVTSPPYDGLREYNGYVFDFDAIARQLWRITKPGGVVVWVVADQTVDGSETGNSFRQALGFMGVGFKLHDTMIYQKAGVLGGAGNPPWRYSQDFEYMFILTKDNLEQLPKLIKEPSNNAGKKITGTTRRNKYKDHYGDGKKKINHDGQASKPEKVKSNVWVYNIGFNHTTKDKVAFDHPAIFPEALARDHILSWSNPGDIVLDPMIGSGTTAKMALLTGRHYLGFDISQEYVDLARERLARYEAQPFLPGVEPSKINKQLSLLAENGE